MIDQAVPQPLGNDPLQRLKLRIDEFDDLAAFDIDQVIVMGFGRGFITRATIAEIVTVKNSGLFEQPYRAIDCRDGNLGINCRGPFMHGFDVGMIFRLGQNPCNDPALLSNSEAAFSTERFKINGLMHGDQISG